VRREAIGTVWERQAKQWLRGRLGGALRAGGNGGAWSANQQDRCDNYVDDAGDLRVGESPENARIDANNFHEKSGDAAEKQIDAEKFSGVTCVIQPAGADAPENPENYDSGEKFVNGSWMNFLGGGNNSIWKAHAPRQRGGNAVVTVTGDEAADAAESVADCGGGRGNVKHLKDGHFVVARDQDKGDCSANCSAGESESHGAEKLGPRIGEKFLGSFQIKINAGADESGESGDADDYVGIGGEAAAFEILLHHEESDEQADGYENSVSA
jgi:hypothetical protein